MSWDTKSSADMTSFLTLSTGGILKSSANSTRASSLIQQLRSLGKERLERKQHLRGALGDPRRGRNASGFGQLLVTAVVRAGARFSVCVDGAAPRPANPLRLSVQRFLPQLPPSVLKEQVCPALHLSGNPPLRTRPEQQSGPYVPELE